MEMQEFKEFSDCLHSGAILKGLNDLRKESQFCDVVLISDEVRIYAHKNVLAAASSYFLAMFNGYFPESTKNEIVLQDMDPQCLQLIVDYMYTGSLYVNAANAQRLLMTASFLQVAWVEERCAEYMTTILEPSNCLGFMQFAGLIAEKQCNNILLNVAENFAIKHFQQVMRHEEFLDLTYDELLSFLCNDEIYMHSEDALLLGLSRWVQHSPEERVKHFSQFVSLLHPACVSEELVRSMDLLNANECSSKWRQNVLDSASNREWNIYVLDKMGRKPDLSKFDLSFGALTSLKPLPNEAFAVSLVGHKNFLYVQGGCAGRSRCTSFYYNLYRDLWHKLQPLLEPRSHHRSLVVEDFLYALGGNSKKSTTNTVECLDLETNTSMYVESMLAQRSSMGAVTKDNCLYVMGGETDHRSLHSTERFDPREGRWHELASLSTVNSYCTSAAIGDHIYCCEGLGNSMERYDIRSGIWELIDFCDEREFYEIFAVNNCLYSISGEEISRYLIEENQWLTVYEFPSTREWDTAVGMHVMNYCV